MAIETRQVITGKRRNLAVDPDDLKKLQKLRQPHEKNIALTFHRIVEQAEMYAEIMKMGEVSNA